MISRSKQAAKRNPPPAEPAAAIPFDIQAEMYVAGCSLLGHLHADVRPEHLHNLSCRLILTAAISLRNSGELTDCGAENVIRVVRWLSGNHRLAEAGGPAALNTCMAAVTHVEFLPYHAGRVLEMTYRRSAIAFAGDIDREARNVHGDVTTLCEKIRGGVK